MTTNKRSMCAGCRDNFYNGQNPYGIQECWNLKSARIVLKKRVAMDQRPPWDQKPIRVLSCRHEKGYVFVGKDQRC